MCSSTNLSNQSVHLRGGGKTGGGGGKKGGGEGKRGGGGGKRGGEEGKRGEERGKEGGGRKRGRKERRECRLCNQGFLKPATN